VNPEVAILADGEPPVGAAAAVFLSAAAVVACDGALRTARALGREPDFTVGDGDSLTAAEKAELGPRFIHVAEQETNDLAKAVRFVRTRYPAARAVVIFGAGGLREDHFLGNVFRLPGFAAELPEIALVTNAGRFDVVTGERRFACAPGDPVSVFAPDPATHAASEGLAWPLDAADLSELWRGTLNRATGTSFLIRTTRPLLTYRPGAVF